MSAKANPDPAPAAIAPAGGLWRYIGYYGLGEAAQRATRLATTVVLARHLSAAELGAAATAITVFELIRVVGNAGVGQAVIRAPENRLAGTCRTAHRLMWAVCTTLAVVQALAGAAIGWASGRGDIALMLAALAGVYLLMPPALIQTYLLQRDARHGTIAAVATSQAVADNVLTALLALTGAGAWAIVLPKLVTAPIWMVGMRRARPWRSDTSIAPESARRIARYALPVIGSELLSAARLQLDKVIVGMLLGVEALGIYYFVFNAGIGLSLSLTGALSASLYPHLAAAAREPRRLLVLFDRAFVRNALPVAGVIVLQAMLAPLYVPVVFGARWSFAAGMVAMLCASASPKALFDAGVQGLRAAGATTAELGATLAVTAVSLAALAVGACYGLGTAVGALAAASGAMQLAAVAWARIRLGRAGRAAGEPSTAAALRVAHLLDDPSLGGVTRFLDALGHGLGASVVQSRHQVEPRHRLAPALDADVVVVHFSASWSKLPFLLALRVRNRRCPIIHVEHGYSGEFEARFVARPVRLRALLRLVYVLADRVVAVSYGQAAWMRRARLVPATKLAVIPPFTDNASLADVAAPVARDGPLRLAAFGRYCPQKDFSTLIRAMALVSPQTARLTLRGFGPDAGRLAGEAAALQHVEVGGPVDDLAGFLAVHDAVVVPSCYEPYGLVALEARLAARPVIVTDADGLAEQVEPGAGLVVPIGDAGRLAAAIAELAAEARAGTLESLGHAARRSAQGHARASIQSWLDLLVHPNPARQSRAPELRASLVGPIISLT